MTIDEMIAVLQAYKAGKPIQNRRRNSFQGWTDIFSTAWPRFTFGEFEYRIKPEAREWWLRFDSNAFPYWVEHNARIESRVMLTKGYIHVREVLEP